MCKSQRYQTARTRTIRDPVTSSNHLSHPAAPDTSGPAGSDASGPAGSDASGPAGSDTSGPAASDPSLVAISDVSGTAAPDTARSALADALATVGDRWTLLLIAALLDGPRRFGELQEEVQGIAPNVLSQRLRQLERNALLVARPYSERPPRFVYELSAAGHDLAGVLRLLAGWGARNAEGAAAPRHAVCGTPMEARWWCPTCERPVAEDEGEELHFA
jgi:DNA-binding HxlR family transcriptional regulator